MAGQSDRKGSGRPPPPRNSSQLVSAVVWASQLKNKVEQSQSIVEKVLPGVSGIEKFKSGAQELKLHLDDYSKDQFKRWSDDLLESLRYCCIPCIGHPRWTDRMMLPCDAYVC
jgi:hypothetical protein